MKKRISKSLSILLAVVMLVGVLCVPAFAAPASVEGHTYDAYQIFQGAIGTNGKMGQIVWGNGVMGDALLADLKNELPAIFGTCTIASDVAKVIGSLDETADLDTLKTVEKLVYKNRTSSPSISNVENGDNLLLDGKAGYFLLVDNTPTSNLQNSAKNLLILKVTSAQGISIASKVDVPSVQKKVKDANDTTPTNEAWQDSADYDIGDDVPFQLTANLATISDYETYKLIFNDTLSKGLTYNGDAVVYVDGVNKGSINGSVIPQSNETTKLTFTLADVKAAPYGAGNNSVVTIEYTAKLNDEAVCGSAGNPNTVFLQYSNNPYESGAGNNNTGKTPEDKVIVFTYIFTVNKVDENNRPLQGASFTLSKNVNGTYVPISTISGQRLSTFTWKGLDDGTYKLEETVVPSGYNKAEDVIFTISATHEENSANPKLLTLTCNPDTLSVDFDEGVISGTVQNVGGEVLPETGGMGTTLFYVIGSLLVLGAGVVLVTKRRMGN